MNVNLPTAIIFSLVVTGTIACSSKAADEPKTSKSVEAPRLPVDVKIVSLTSLNQSEIIAGSLVPNREVQITSEITKKVASVLFQDGSYVSQGQV